MKFNGLKSAFMCASVSVVASTLMVSCGEQKNEAAENVPAKVEQKVKPTTLEAPSEVAVAPVAQVAKVASEVEQTEEYTPFVFSPGHEDHPRVLKDLKTIKVRPGSDSPKIGQLIYTFANLPHEKCGTFWVQGDDGYVDSLAKCSGDHAGGH